MLVDLVTLTDDEIELIRDALKSRNYELLVDMIDYDIDNEDEREKVKALLNKLDGKKMEVIDKLVFMLFVSSAIFMTIVICVFNKYPSKKNGWRLVKKVA